MTPDQTTPDAPEADADYTILVAGDASTLSTSVNHLRRRGWEPQGGISLSVSEPTVAGESSEVWAQAMIKRERGRDAQPGAAPQEVAAPEPQDKLSEEWREWKIAHLSHAWLESHVHDRYTRAWDDFTELLMRLIADEDFWHISHAFSILPQLLRARQEIDRLTRKRADRKAGRRGGEGRRDAPGSSAGASG
jgi:hypothetical protein